VPPSANGKTFIASLEYQAGALPVESEPLKLEF